MRATDRQDAVSLLALVAAVLTVVVATHVKAWADRLIVLVQRPVALTLAAALLTFAALLAVLRLLATRRTLRSRVGLTLVPADIFDPPEEAVVRFASGLGRARRAVRGLLDSPASAVRVRLDHDPAGRLRYGVEVPAHARAALRTAAAAYGGVELREPEQGEARGDQGGGVEVARAELVLARPSTEPLRSAGLDPDPLAAVARALDGLDADRGEAATVCVDLLPVSAARRRRMRRRLLRRARRRDRQSATPPSQGRGDPLADLLGGRRGGTPPADLVSRRADQHALMDKLGSPQPLFFVQVLVRVASPVPGRAKSRIDALLAAFDAFAGENHFRVSGLGVRGVAFLGSDLPGRRRSFERRLALGLFRPARRRVVTAGEVAGLLKPPSARCAEPNVLRSGGVVGPPPSALPSFAGQRELLPLGRIATESGERTVGVPLADTFFLYCAGRSRFGKTEMAMGQFLHLARSGQGCFFLDPHADAIRKLKSYLTREGVAERVVEIDLAAGERQPGWNLFAAAGRSPGRSREQVDAVVAAFASALGWTETNTRALNLTTQAAQALSDLARVLPGELAPTIFQIPTLLSDEGWRAAVLPHVAPATRQFFTQRFPRLPIEAITPVTNLIDRLRVAPAVAALLGNPVSSYDARQAMDRGQIVLVCPGSGGARDRLLANLFVFDLLHAAKSRAELAPERRRPFYAVFDEVQTYDGPSGDLAALLEQSAKFGLRGLLFNQNPERLSAATLNAVTTNRSHLLTTALNSKAAALLAREWGGEPEPRTIAGLGRYAFLASVTLGGEISPPFRLAGTAVEELFPDAAREEELAALEKRIDRTAARRPIAETLAKIEDHDRRILDHLRRHRGKRGARGGGATRGGRTIGEGEA